MVKNITRMNLFAVLISIAMLLPFVTARAQDVTYVDANGIEQTLAGGSYT